ncbi:MAG: CpsD/CapB family tyrosine-protein kinase [Chloroflexi bacterium]|nr:CpsD/CapB family tyrosine-protein kinase [Chloroflexota bacterium]
METRNGRPDLIALSSPHSPAAEAFRALRTSIQFSSLDRALKTLQVTSTGPQEGKSTVLANLAVTMAEAGLQVVAVDCDLRRPCLHELFGLVARPGFTDAVLADDGTPLPLQQTAVKGLRLLAAGALPPNPSELLGSQRAVRVLEVLASQADLVLLDSPPVAAVTDAVVLASRVDGVLWVVSAGKTRRDLARRARAQLEKVNARILGVVLNNVRVDKSLYRYYQS